LSILILFAVVPHLKATHQNVKVSKSLMPTCKTLCKLCKIKNSIINSAFLKEENIHLEKNKLENIHFKHHGILSKELIFHVFFKN
jgi:hypothetical protein